MDLNVRAYCLIGLGNVKDLIKSITELCENEISYVSGTGLVIATFMTKSNIVELENRLNEIEKSYILFEMTPGFFSANIRDDRFQETLFGGPINNSDFFDNLDILSDELFNDINENLYEEGEEEFMSIKDFIRNSKQPKKEDLNIDDILDKISEIGFENLTETEKSFLDDYSKE